MVHFTYSSLYNCIFVGPTDAQALIQQREYQHAVYIADGSNQLLSTITTSNYFQKEKVLQFFKT